jgi:predicted PurR-regulated permease PerM
MKSSAGERPATGIPAADNHSTSRHLKYFTMGRKILLHSTLTIIALYFLFAGLIKAQAFLVPLATAMVLAFLVVPITVKLERLGWHRILATTVSTLLLLLVVVGFVFMLFQQIRNFTEDWEQIQEKLQERIVDVKRFLEENTPLENVDFNLGPGFRGNDGQDENGQDQQLRNGQQQEEEDAEEMDAEIQEAAQAVGEQVVTTLGAVFSFLGYFLLTFVYVFMFIYFRGRFKQFILRFFSHERREEVSGIIAHSTVVSRRYLAGRLLLMVILAGLYYAGLAISGLENALFIALISAALSIIPIVGNFVGYFIALGVSLLTNGDLTQVIGISLTFLIAQFIDTYILQPIVLGDRVDVHPFFIIVTVILGNEVWGVMGMVLAIPLFAIITVVCRQVPALNPFGYLFSKKDIKETRESRAEKRRLESGEKNS